MTTTLRSLPTGTGFGNGLDGGALGSSGDETARDPAPFILLFGRGTGGGLPCYR